MRSALWATHPLSLIHYLDVCSHDCVLRRVLSLVFCSLIRTHNAHTLSHSQAFFLSLTLAFTVTLPSAATRHSAIETHSVSVCDSATQWKNQGVSCEHFYALSATPRRIVLLPALLKEKSGLDDCCLSAYTLTLDLSALDDVLFLWILIFQFSVRIVCSNLHLTFYFVLAGATLPTSTHFYFLLRARALRLLLLPLSVMTAYDTHSTLFGVSCRDNNKYLFENETIFIEITCMSEIYKQYAFIYIYIFLEKDRITHMLSL